MMKQFLEYDNRVMFGEKMYQKMDAGIELEKSMFM